MKKKSQKLIPFTLSAALLIGAFALCQAESPAAQSLTEEGDSSELFSDRDLSGDYDASSAVSIILEGAGARADSDAVRVSGSAVTITDEGTYLLSGNLENGSITIDADKEDKVQLVLDGAAIHSETFAAIYVLQADKVFVTLKEGTQNSLSNGGSFSQIDDNEVDAVIFSKDDLTINGTGGLTVSSPAGHGIVGKDELTITGGEIEITAQDNAIRAKDSIAIAGGSFILSAQDGLHAENSDDESLGNIYITGGAFMVTASDDAIHANTLLQIDGGSFDLTAAEGLEATYIRINDGAFRITASDDGVNAAYKSSACTPTVEINGGSLTIVMASGDTDAVDSNSDLIINGGTLDITASSAFDYDGSAQYNGGVIIVNGETVNAIQSQMMGGGMNGMGGRGKGFRGW